MAAFLEPVNGFSSAWAGLMGAILWQSTLVIVIVTIVALLLRRGSPTIRYWLWQIVAVKLLLMPFWVLAVPWPFPDLRPLAAAQPVPSPSHIAPQAVPLPSQPSAPPSTMEPAPPIAGGPAEPPVAVTRLNWSSSLLILWACVVAWRLGAIVQQRRRLGQLLRLTTPAESPLADQVAGMAARLGLRRPPRTLLVDSPVALFVCGWFKPALVLPRTLPAALRPAELEQVILHELAHLKRGDLVWGWTIELARIVYFFHPLVYWVAYCLHLERELACDQLAMAVGGHSPGDYAHTLVQVATHACEPTVPQVAALATSPARRQTSKESVRNRQK